MARLLDVNGLIALVDSDHVSHQAMRRWFTKNWKLGWATCPLTENGMVRVMSQSTYASGQRRPVEIIQVLNVLKETFGQAHEFWADDISITDAALFDFGLIAATKLVTDAYLIGLAAKHDGILVSFDRRLIWQAVRGGTANLIHLLEA